MNVDLEIFTFQNISYVREEEYSVDWEVLGKKETDNHNEEIVFISNDIKKVDDGFEITIYSNINIPAHSLSQNDIHRGTYERYNSKSVFFTEHNKVTDSMIAEFTLSHFNSCSKDIFVSTNTKTNGKNPYMIKTLSLSKIILMVESCGHKNN